MLMGHVEGLAKFGSSKDLLLADPVSDFDGDEKADGQALYMASFEELAAKNVQYNTVIWLLISLLLILAWGIGIFMLLYLPIRRHILKKDIESRKLYVTPTEIVYKVSRPSFVPFWGETRLEKHVPLHLVIDIIVEQGCLQSIYGIHTLRIESIACGKAAPVDDLQVQGVYNPGNLRKVIVNEASKAIQEVGRSRKFSSRHVQSTIHTESLSEGPWKVIGSSHNTSLEHSNVPPEDTLLHKLEEVNRSVKKIESLIEKSQGSSRSIQ